MKEEPLHPWIEPELEARIVALVLGEASDFEREELERLIEEKAELAMFKKRMEAMHGLLREVATGESAETNDEWKLGDERRQVVLAVIDGGVKAKLPSSNTSSLKITSVKTDSVHPKLFIWKRPMIKAIALAAVITLSFSVFLKTTYLGKKALMAPQMVVMAQSYGENDEISSDNVMKLQKTSRAAKSAANRYTINEAKIRSRGIALLESNSIDDLTDTMVSADLFDDDSAPSTSATEEVAMPIISVATYSSAPTPNLERLVADTADKGGGVNALAEEVYESAVIAGFRDIRSKDRQKDFYNFAANAPAKATAISPSMRDQLRVAKADAIADYDENMPSKVLAKKKVVTREFREDQFSRMNIRPELKTEKNKNLTPQLKENKDHAPTTNGMFALTSPFPSSLGKSVKIAAHKPVSIAPEFEQRKQQPSSPPTGLNEKNAADEAFSTFSLHVSDVSFKLTQAALAKGEWPEASKVRIEEFVNAFDYGDPMPNQNEKVANQMEQSIHPFLQQRNLLRISMRTAAAGRSAQTPLRLTFLLDNSGSMERSDRQQTVQRAFALLAQQLKPMDQVTLISFARQPRLLADQVSGSKANQLVQLVANIPSEGGTNLEAALKLAFEKAQEQQLDHAQNRIIMLTDGAANLGDADPARLSQMIETMRDAGIAFDAAGIGADGLNDEILEALTRKGDGRYYLLDQPENADAGFARQIAGALRPAAKNVKVQIEFNPNRVGHYKLLGYEKHRLEKEDFRNDQVDAAEMAAAEAGVAVYQFEAKADGEGDVGSVSVRFRDLSTGQMVEKRWPIPYQADAPRLDQAAPSLRIASTAALFAAKLKGDPLANNVDFATLSQLIGGLPQRQLNTKKVQELQQMINAAQASNP